MARKILGEDDAGEFKIEIPDDSFLTFGPNAPYATKGEKQGYGTPKQEGWSLRVYSDKGKTNLFACLTNVKWFRETTVSMSRVVEKVVSSTVYKNDDGSYETTEQVVRSKQLMLHSDDGMGLQSPDAVDVTPSNTNTAKKGKK